MKFTVRRVIAAFAVVVSVFIGVGVAASPASAATAVTTPDETTWCRVYFGGSNASSAPADQNNPYSWRCLLPHAGGGWDWTNVGIDMNKACEYAIRRVYPGAAGDARLVAPTPYHPRAFDWFCFH